MMEAGFSTVSPSEEPGFPSQWSVRMGLVTGLVWGTATLPWIGLVLLTWKGAIRPWVIRTALLCSLVSALGFELWFTYGLVDGQPVTERRPEPLNRAMPRDVNWLLNSLSDGSICMVGMLIIYLVSQEDGCRRVAWRSALPCTAWFILQNVAVEMVIYSTQLAEGTRISWAPLAPTGPYWNPTLLRIGSTTCSLQAQLPWVFMTPIFYCIMTWQFRRAELEAEAAGKKSSLPFQQLG